MLLFSSVLRLKDSVSKDLFISLVLEWNRNSPHSENRIEGIVWTGEKDAYYGDDNLWMHIFEYESRNTIAVRYQKTEESGVIWTTDYIMNFDDMKLAVQLDRSYTEDAIEIKSEFSTPYIITLLIDKGYIADDGELAVSYEPVVVDRSMLELLSNVISGKQCFERPVIYVSRTFAGNIPVDAEQLAYRLKGTAHVMVQGSGWSNGDLRELCGGLNEINGSIGIYYPNRAAGHKRITYSGNSQDMLHKTAIEVMNYANIQQIDTLYTWQGVTAALLYDKYESQSAERKFAELLVDSVSAEIEEYRRKIDELVKENLKLTAENTGLVNKISCAGERPVIVYGEEKELFTDEIKEMVLLAVSEKAAALRDGTRSKDVLMDLLKTNEFQNTAAGKADLLKNAFKGYKNMSNGLKRTLTDMGFEIQGDGKHYKLIYHGDERYFTTLSKTASDGRTGDNIVQEIIKGML